LKLHATYIHILGQPYTSKGTSHFFNVTSDLSQESSPGQVAEKNNWWALPKREEINSLRFLFVLRQCKLYLFFAMKFCTEDQIQSKGQWCYIYILLVSQKE